MKLSKIFFLCVNVFFSCAIFSAYATDANSQPKKSDAQAVASQSSSTASSAPVTEMPAAQDGTKIKTKSNIKND